MALFQFYLNFLGKKLGFRVKGNIGTMTAGLVQQYDHSVLPTILPVHTFLITLISIVVSFFFIYMLSSTRVLICININKILSYMYTASIMETVGEPWESTTFCSLSDSMRSVFIRIWMACTWESDSSTNYSPNVSTLFNLYIF